MVLNEWIMYRDIEMAQYECSSVGGEEECELTASLRNVFIMPWERGRALHQTAVIFDTGFLMSQFLENRVSD